MSLFVSKWFKRIWECRRRIEEVAKSGSCGQFLFTCSDTFAVGVGHKLLRHRQTDRQTDTAGRRQYDDRQLKMNAMT